ncbi:hypothetical protein G6L12_08400 [Agrobacterium rhizogenes]|nr:hypothetical protein [Rhizobium rhizogenes]NTF74493.1 hypothetical protein [Rhizobium rhizogenes]
MIKLDLWDIINAKEPKPRGELPESLEKPEKPVGKQDEAEDAKGRRDRPEADPSKCRD